MTFPFTTLCPFLRSPSIKSLYPKQNHSSQYSKNVDKKFQERTKGKQKSPTHPASPYGITRRPDALCALKVPKKCKNFVKSLFQKMHVQFDKTIQGLLRRLKSMFNKKIFYHSKWIIRS